MYVVEDTLDDLMHNVLSKLVAGPYEVTPTRSNEGGATSEIIGCCLKLTNPRARLSRSETRGKLFSAIGELLWYFSRKNDLDFISYYIKRYKDEAEGEIIYGGYGPRIFNLRNKYDQFNNIIKLLKKKPNSRRAVIQIFDGEDLASEHVEIPCTCTLQFFVRNNSLSLVVHMRSNDAFLGLPHDIFAFTMLQEVAANILGIGLGNYTHLVGSLHLYERDRNAVQKYLDEGFFSTKIFMPQMPQTSPIAAISTVLINEEKIRKGEELSVSDIASLKLPEFWKDIIILLQVNAVIKKSKIISQEERNSRLIQLKEQLHSSVYNIYIDQKID